eukprot:gnl/MRDRNA2_/MRDRNA2_114725_c0_seq1.p1 gnl/MRDRNA2_/MRDRNA2_114725_c0~~gnl/MRDRNA2_/MRDRNA2_114725_c0_seq1.p1  ORF type:complete len:639 (+),score=86.16 gnl/MRDRNA2_/MRDRNA2_114725_c0_seq1:73-1989(+)
MMPSTAFTQKLTQNKQGDGDWEKPTFPSGYPCVAEVGVKSSTIEVRSTLAAVVWYRLEEVGTVDCRREARCHAASWESVHASQPKHCIFCGLSPNTHYCARVMLLPDEPNIKDLLGSGELQPFGENRVSDRLNRLLLRCTSELLWFTTCNAYPEFSLPVRLEPMTGAKQVRVLRFPVDRPCRVYYATIKPNSPTPRPFQMRDCCGPRKETRAHRSMITLEDRGWSDVAAGHVRIMIQRNPKDDMRDVVVVAEMLGSTGGRAGDGMQPMVSRVSPVKDKPEASDPFGRRTDAHLLHLDEAGDAYQWSETAMTVLDQMDDVSAASWRPLALPFRADPSWGEDVFEGRNWLVVGEGMVMAKNYWEMTINDDEGLVHFGLRGGTPGQSATAVELIRQKTDGTWVKGKHIEVPGDGKWLPFQILIEPSQITLFVRNTEHRWRVDVDYLNYRGSAVRQINIEGVKSPRLHWQRAPDTSSVVTRSRSATDLSSQDSRDVGSSVANISVAVRNQPEYLEPSCPRCKWTTSAKVLLRQLYKMELSREEAFGVRVKCKRCGAMIDPQSCGGHLPDVLQRLAARGDPDVKFLLDRSEESLRKNQRCQSRDGHRPGSSSLVSRGRSMSKSGAAATLGRSSSCAELKGFRT